MNDGQEPASTPADGASPSLGDNSGARYEAIKDDFRKLRRIEELKAKLNDRAEKIRANLEKESGVNRGALADISRLSKLSTSAIVKREESRKELFSLLIKPKLDAAEEADAAEAEAEAATQDDGGSGE